MAEEGDCQAGGDPFYRDLCSARTLATERQGFFAELAALVTDSDDVDADARMEVFGASRNDEEHVLAVYAMPQVREVLANACPVFRGKDAVVSEQRRLAADRALADGALETALELYSQAVVRAPSGVGAKVAERQDNYVDKADVQESVACEGDGEGVVKGRRRRRRRKKGVDKTPATPVAADQCCLAEALAGRSAALAALGKHKLCVLDVRAALALGVTPELSAALCHRLADSCNDLGWTDLAAECQDVKSHEVLRVADKAARAASETRLPGRPDTLAGGEHTVLRDASARLALAETPTSGRFVVAAEPLAAGDTLLVQSPHAVVTFTEADGSHCHHCLARLEAAVPCLRCSALAFCSERCRTLANVYHEVECRFHDLLIGSGASALCRLALRIVTQHPVSFFLGLRPRMADRAAVDEAETYLRVHALETHASRRSVDDFLQRTIMALFLLRILQRAGYFPTASADDAASLSEDESFIGALLLRHLQLLQFNAHEVAEMRTSGAATRYRSVGVGIYPTAALFNHDCHPAVARHFDGSRMVLRLLRPVARGAAVGENYGPTYTRLPVALRRRALLSRYWFRCECSACRNDWPKAEGLCADRFRFRCPGTGCIGVLVQSLPPPSVVRCASCTRTLSLDDAGTALTTTVAGVESAIANADVGQLARCVDQLHALGVPPCSAMQRAEDALRRLFAVQ